MSERDREREIRERQNMVNQPYFDAQADIEYLLQLLDAERQRVERLAGVVEQVQWCAGTTEAEYCPLCDQSEDEGHALDCPIGEALEVSE